MDAPTVTIQAAKAQSPLAANFKNSVSQEPSSDQPEPRKAIQPVEQTNTATKTRCQRKKKKRGMKPADPAINVTRGFHTPTTSAGEESDISAVGTPRLGASVRASPSIPGSPLVRPSGLSRALSELKIQDDCSEDGRGRPEDRQKGDIARQHTLHSSPLGLALDESEMSDSGISTYDVSFKKDYISPENKHRRILGAIEGGLRTDSPHRKMTARDFQPVKCLGKGTYGTVLLVRQHTTGRLFAQKQLKKATLTVHKRLIEQTKSERAILESVNRHPFVVKLFYAFQDREKLYLILEYAQGGELFHHLSMERMFSEEVAAFYMAEMVLALDHLHRNLGVIYRDLKPENCLLDAEGHLLLTDFGLSKVAATDPDSDADSDTSRCNSVLGTVDYMAPEVIQGKPYDAAVDWWSLGALGFDLLTGAPPFASANTAKTQQKIVHGGKIQMPYYIGPDAKDLLLRLLRREPRKRLGGSMPRDMATLKAHRFFRRVDWKALEKRECVAPIQPIVTDPAAAENFSTEFTDLAVSPVLQEKRALSLLNGIGSGVQESGACAGNADTAMGVDGLVVDHDDNATQVVGSNPFGGFTFVASSSLLETAILDV